MIRSFFKKLPLFEALVLFIALLTLMGWEPIGNTALMSYATAIAFIVCIASKLFFEYASINKNLLLPARILALCVLLAGIVTITANVFQFDSINNSFFIERAKGPEFSIVLITEFCFVLIGTALYCITLSNAERIFFPHVISLITLFIALLSAIAYFFTPNTFHGIIFHKPMGIATSINFFLISFSILQVNKGKGFMGQITSEYQGAKIARLLIPMAIAIPILLGFFQLETEKTNLYSNPYHVALITIGRIIVLVFFIWRTAVIINRSNKAVIAEIAERKKNEETLRFRKALLEAQNEAIPDAILIVDTEGKILSYNHHFIEIWRIPEYVIKDSDDTAALKFAMTQLVDPDRKSVV